MSPSFLVLPLLLLLTPPSSAAPTDLHLLEDLFFYGGGGGIALGLGGGLLTAGIGAALGLKAKKAKINTLANIVNSKVGLLNLKTNIVRTGIEGASFVNNLLGQGEKEEEEEEQGYGGGYRGSRGHRPSYRRSYSPRRYSYYG